MINNYRIGASILRFLLGFLILKDFVTYTINREYLFSRVGIVDYEMYLDIINYYNIEYLNIDFNNEYEVYLYLFLGVFFSILFMLGIFQFISTGMLYFLLLIFKIRNLYLLDGADNLILVILPLFLFIRTNSFIEWYDKMIETLIKRFRLSVYSETISYYFCLAIMVQICIVYLFAGLHKLAGDVWRDGTALYYILNSNDFSPTTVSKKITDYIYIIKALTWFTIFFQILFSIFIWIKKCRYIVIILGILLHIGIFFLMKIDNFSFLLIFCYAIFIEDRVYKNIILKYNIRI